MISIATVRAALAAGFTLVGVAAFATMAAAQSLFGQWVTSGQLPNGGLYRFVVVFQPDGTYLSQGAVTASQVNNPAGLGAGIMRCVAQYSFDGQTLQMTPQQCDRPGMPPLPGIQGPVVFMGPNQMNIAGEIYLRQ